MAILLRRLFSEAIIEHKSRLIHGSDDLAISFTLLFDAVDIGPVAAVAAGQSLLDEALMVGAKKGALALLHYVCLLYTSPSPRDLSTSRMPSSA